MLKKKKQMEIVKVAVVKTEERKGGRGGSRGGITEKCLPSALLRKVQKGWKEREKTLKSSIFVSAV